jgi:hypothetical protein
MRLYSMRRHLHHHLDIAVGARPGGRSSSSVDRPIDSTVTLETCVGCVDDGFNWEEGNVLLNDFDAGSGVG